MAKARFWLVTQLLLAMLTIALAISVSLGRSPLALLFTLAAGIAGVAGIDGPARGALTRTLVKRELYPSAAGRNHYGVGTRWLCDQPFQSAAGVLGRRCQLRRIVAGCRQFTTCRHSAWRNPHSTHKGRPRFRLLFVMRGAAVPAGCFPSSGGD